MAFDASCFHYSDSIIAMMFSKRLVLNFRDCHDLVVTMVTAMIIGHGWGVIVVMVVIAIPIHK